jgi:hypothetical protein
MNYETVPLKYQSQINTTNYIQLYYNLFSSILFYFHILFDYFLSNSSNVLVNEL